MSAIYTMKGVQALLEVYEDKIVITPKGLLGRINKGTSGSRTILISSICAIHFKKAGLSSGYLQFTILGGTNPKPGVMAAVNDENSFLFTGKDNEEAESIKLYIEEAIQALNAPRASSSSSVVEELEKLASLKEQKVLSSGEFEQAKQKVINSSSPPQKHIPKPPQKHAPKPKPPISNSSKGTKKKKPSNNLNPTALLIGVAIFSGIFIWVILLALASISLFISLSFIFLPVIFVSILFIGFKKDILPDFLKSMILSVKDKVIGMLTFGLVCLMFVSAGLAGIGLYWPEREKCNASLAIKTEVKSKSISLQERLAKLKSLQSRINIGVPHCSQILRNNDVLELKKRSGDIQKKINVTHSAIRKKQIIEERKRRAKERKRKAEERRKKIESFPKRVKDLFYKIKKASRLRRKRRYKDAHLLLSEVKTELKFVENEPVGKSKNWRSLNRKLKKERRRLQPRLDYIRKREKEAKAKAKLRAALKVYIKRLRGPKPRNSAWDGSIYQVVQFIKNNYLRDPDSFQHIGTSNSIPKGECWVVRMKYRAKNAFGGYVVENKFFCVNTKGVKFLKF